MNLQGNRTKKNNFLKKFNSCSILSNIFSFIPKKKSIQILQINKKLSALLNLFVADYYLDKKYQEIIENSNGNLNYIFLKSLDYYKQFYCENDKNHPKFAFTELISNIIQYLKYLLANKKIKTLILSFEENIFINWLYFKFVIEIIRNIKYGLSLKMNRIEINYRYYEVIKDSIHDMKEINSITLFDLKNKKEKYLKDYFNFCDWTKVKCLHLSGLSFNSEHNERIKDIYIPDNALFRKLIVDDRGYFNLRKLYDLIKFHGRHIDHLKLLYFNDQCFYGNDEKVLKKDIFENLINLKKIKFIKAKHLLLLNFLLFGKKFLPSIKVLILDEVCEFDNYNFIYIQNHYNDMLILIQKLRKLEKLEINFNYMSTILHAFQMLTIIINNNSDIKDLKITLPVEKIENNKNLKVIKEQIYFEKMVKTKSIKVDEDEIKKEKEINAFSILINTISTLKQLRNLQLIIPMNNKMSKIFNNCFNVGDSLNYLYIFHSNYLNLNQVFKRHGNLNKINLNLIKDGDENPLNKFIYDFPRRTWKSIDLSNYPLNNSFIEALIKSKCSIKHLSLKNSFNISTKTDAELNNILLEIKNKLNN